MEILISYIQLTQLVGVVVGSKTSVKETNDIALTGDGRTFIIFVFSLLTCGHCGLGSLNGNFDIL